MSIITREKVTHLAQENPKKFDSIKHEVNCLRLMESENEIHMTTDDDTHD